MPRPTSSQKPSKFNRITKRAPDGALFDSGEINKYTLCMQPIIPPKLKRGDTIRVIAPSRSMGIISQQNRMRATKRLEELGLQVTFGEHVEEIDDFNSSSIASRVSDLQQAFSDASVQGILTVVGGFNSHQIFREVDWELIKNNPKVLCGYSDITALANAIYRKTGLVAYSGPHWSTFAQQEYLDYTVDYFKRCLFQSESYLIESSPVWLDDEWYLNEGSRVPEHNAGHVVLQGGEAEGTIIGGNIGTFNLLQGTEYMPSLEDSVLFLEDDSVTLPHTFDRDLQSLIHQPGFEGVRGIVIGRFQKASKLPANVVRQIIQSKRELHHLPIIADVDFGHTNPIVTFPIGGRVRMSAVGDKTTIEILTH